MKKLMARAQLGNKGFTLVELIIVIAIIAVLAAVLAPQYIKYVDKSRWAADQNSAATLLSEVNVAVTEAGENSVTLADFTITINASGTTINPTNSPIKDNLDNIDAQWDELKVKNKNSATGAKKTFTITYDHAKGSVSGVWS